MSFRPKNIFDWIAYLDTGLIFVTIISSVIVLNNFAEEGGLQPPTSSPAAEANQSSPSAGDSGGLTDGAYVVSAEDIVRGRMRDPDSAKFIDEFVVRHPGKNPVVCGYINAKNGFGGYDGKEAFVSFGTEKGTALQTDMTASGFRMVWKKLCRP